jgi:hypothetical protein
MRNIFTILERGKRVISGPVNPCVADGFIVTKHLKYHVRIFLPSFMYACPHHGLWVTCMQLSHAKAGNELPGTSQLREKTLAEKFHPSGLLGVGVGLTTQLRKMTCTEIRGRPWLSLGFRVDDDDDSMGFAGYVAVCVQLYCICFTVLHLVVTVLHYMFRPTWPSSNV